MTKATLFVSEAGTSIQELLARQRTAAEAVAGRIDPALLELASATIPPPASPDQGLGGSKSSP